MAHQAERTAVVRWSCPVVYQAAIVLVVACGREVTTPLPPVTVTAISPAAGPIAGGTRVTIAGANFIDVTGVAIGSGELRDLAVVSATQITGTTPPAITPAVVDIAVSATGRDSGTCADCFTYNPVVIVADVQPDSGAVAGGTAVTITGRNFIDVTDVTIGGTAVGNQVVVSTTKITGTVPPGAGGGTADVVVTTGAHGIATCAGCFTYVTAALRANLP